MGPLPHRIEDRWEQLQKAYITIFDLRATAGPDRAAVAYELGIARTLGKPVVVLAQEDQIIPFDVDGRSPFCPYDPVSEYYNRQAKKIHSEGHQISNRRCNDNVKMEALQIRQGMR